MGGGDGSAMGMGQGARQAFTFGSGNMGGTDQGGNMVGGGIMGGGGGMNMGGNMGMGGFGAAPAFGSIGGGGGGGMTPSGSQPAFSLGSFIGYIDNTTLLSII